MLRYSRSLHQVQGLGLARPARQHWCHPHQCSAIVGDETVSIQIPAGFKALGLSTRLRSAMVGSPAPLGFESRGTLPTATCFLHRYPLAWEAFNLTRGALCIECVSGRAAVGHYSTTWMSSLVVNNLWQDKAHNVLALELRGFYAGFMADRASACSGPRTPASPQEP